MQISQKGWLALALCAGCQGVLSGPESLELSGPSLVAVRARELDRPGLIAMQLRVAQVSALQTLGLGARVEHGRLAQWQREDAFFRKAGGQVLQVVGNSDGRTLELAVSTTRAVSTENEQGEAVATLFIAPEGDDGAVHLDLDGAQRGAVLAGGKRLTLHTLDGRFGAASK